MRTFGVLLLVYHEGPRIHEDIIPTNYQEKAFAEMRGEFIKQISGRIVRGNLVDFPGPSPLEKNRRNNKKNPPQNPQQNSKSELGSFAAKIRTASISAWLINFLQQTSPRLLPAKTALRISGPIFGTGVLGLFVSFPWPLGLFYAYSPLRVICISSLLPCPQGP